MDEETKKEIEELKARIEYLESRIKKLATDCSEHKHNLGDKLPTLNY